MINSNKMDSNSDHRGIGYYNTYNINNKDNKENTLPLKESNTENEFLIQSFGLASREEKEARMSPEGVVGSAAPGLDENSVLGTVVQLFDNGQNELQQYKLKVRLNLTDKSNPEFIAPLTKNIQNFKRYIPQPYRDELITLAQQSRKEIRDKFDVWPYLGKFHLNQGRSAGTHKISIEPNTMAIVWYNNIDKHWTFTLRIHDFTLLGDLDETYLTSKQKVIGVKCQYVYRNEKFIEAERPLTWIEQRRQGKI
jgi:hypothetical protein